MVQRLRVSKSLHYKFMQSPSHPSPSSAAEVERCLSVADEVARTVEQSLAQAERLRRQSILKRAFEGRLVAQDAGDEPAGGAAGED